MNLEVHNILGNPAVRLLMGIASGVINRDVILILFRRNSEDSKESG
jgi:hypothetical protein